MHHCSNCSTEVSGNYCSHCGTPKTLTRINGTYIFSEIGSILNFDKGILYTIRELILRPGINIRNFVEKDRNRLVKPVVFIIITSLIYTLAQHWLQFEDGYVNYSANEGSALTSIFSWVQGNYGYANMIMAIFIGLWIKVFFKKYDFNFYEIIILLCFVMGVGMLIYTLFGIAESITGIHILHIGGVLAFVYVTWAIGSFFDKSKKMNFFKGLLSYILGMISFSISAVAIGLIIDYLY